MKYFSVCSGVEAATQAWKPLGWEAVAFSEIEPFPCAVLAARYPDVPNLGDMTKITYNRKTETLSNGTVDVVCNGGIDLLVGGTPCQSFSYAGLRKGLSGASGLAYHFIRLLGEIKPRWFVWENVPGALSSVSNGQRDFNFLIRQYAECGYDIEWRVLDTQYVRTPRFPRAIPQRRRRLFVVGHLAADGVGGFQVLLEPEGLRGYCPPRRVKGQGIAGHPATRAGMADTERSVYAIIDMHGGKIGAHFTEGDGASPSLTRGRGSADDVHSVAVRVDEGHGIPVALRGNRNTTDRGKLPETDGTGAAYTITGAQADSMVCVKQDAIGFDPAPRECLKRQFVELQTTLQPGTCPGHHNAVALAYRLDSTASNSMKSGNPNSGIHETDAHCALDTLCPNPARGQGGVAIVEEVDGDIPQMRTLAIENHPNDSRFKLADDVCQTMPSRMGTGGGNEPMVMTPTTFRATSQFGEFKQDAVSSTLDCAHMSSIGNGTPAIIGDTIQAHYAVRRITPIEGERLQGFADNWTRIPWRGKPEEQCPDGPRYKAIGNSMSVNVMEWIGIKIARAERRAGR